MSDIRDLIKYPFLPEAVEFVKGIDLEELLSSPLYEDARNYGIYRVMSCFEKKRPMVTSDENKIIGFYIAKLLLMALNDPIVTRRFANMMRDEIEKFLLYEEEYENIYRVADHFKIEYKEITEDLRKLYEKYPKPWMGNAKYEIFTMVHFIDFIKYASKLSGDTFKLVYQPLKNGWIPIGKEEFIKVLREAFVYHFIKDIEMHSEQGKEIKKYFKKDIEYIRNLKDEYISKYSSKEFGSVNEEAFPPCLKSIIVKLKNGVNLPHQARFFLVTFLHKIGMKNEDIMKIFATAPDFNESMTKYQVEHITGEISNKEYEVPKCSTLQAYGLCIKDIANDNLCKKDWMSHPLLYYKIKKEWLSKHKKSSESQ